jgi:surface antigen
MPRPLTLEVVFSAPTPPAESTQRPPAVAGRVLRVEHGKRVGSGQCVALARSYGFAISGNARQWPENAKKAGYRVDTVPEVGAALVTSESSAGTDTGHVAIIEDIKDGYLYLVEQNYVRLTISRGRIPIGSKIIVSVIHKS